MKSKLLKMLKRTLCYVLVLGMISGSLLPMQAEAASGAALIAHYDFEAAEGTNVPNKVDANTYAGTLRGNGASIVADTELGKSLKFSGADASWMQIDSIVNTGAKSYSISMWYKYDTTVSRGNKRVVLLQQNGGGRTLLTLTSGNQYHTYVNSSDVTGDATINPAKWQHVTIVNNADTDQVTWYVNGVFDSTKSAGTGSVNELTALLVGCHKSGQDDPMYMRGLVDEIKLYEGIVTAEEAKAIYDEKAELVKAAEPEDDDNFVLMTIDSEAVERTVDESIFGINHRYAFNGYGSFDSNTMKVKDDFRKLYEEAGFGSIRYPGGTISNLFNWKTSLDSVGRKDQIHGFYNNSGQGGITPNFGIKEIADFADEVNSEIVYVYSLGRGSVQDAEDLIEFLNAEVGTNPNGGIDWAKVRSENGHSKPYNVRYFEIGNEMQQVYSDGTTSQGYWLHGMSNAENGYIEGGTATFTNQYAVCEEDWNQQASKSDGSAGMVRYMRYANTNPKKYDENGKIVDDKDFVAVEKGSVSVSVDDTAWIIVDNFDNSSATDKHVVVDYSTGALIFGDGEKGAIPASGQQINVSYSVKRDGFVDISRAMKETTEKINQANEKNGVDAEHEALVYSSYETQGFISKMSNGGYNDLYDGLTIHPYSGTPSGSGAAFYDSAMALAESAGVGKVQNYVNMLPEGKVPVISEYGIFRSTDSLVRSQTHAVYIAKVLMEYVRLGSPYIQKHCLIDWYSSGADSLGPTQQAVIQAVAQNGADTKTGEGNFAFFATPSARVFQMLNSSFGTEILASSFDVQETLDNGVKAYSALASKDQDENYYAAFVNVDRENAKNLEIKVEGVDFTGKEVEVQMLSSDSVSDENTLENPDKVAVETTVFTAAESTVTVEVPKHSFAVIKVVADKSTDDTTAPGQVKNLQAEFIGKYLKLTWDAPEDEDVAKYQVYDWLANNFSFEVTETEIVLKNLELGNAYTLGVRAIDAAGNKSLENTILIIMPTTAKTKVVRISGKDRYATGYKVADAYKEELGVDKFDKVVVATGKNFADALSGSYLAIVKEAPIILTNGKDDNVAELHTYIKENVNANGTVYILGGTAAVPATVDAIESEGYTVKRLAGASRYDTNLEILAEAGITGTELIVATGKEFADSLSASATGRPILLVKPGADLSAEQKSIAQTVEGGNIYVVGGTGAVADTTAAELEAYATVERIAGAGRQETSKKIAEKFFADAETVVAASAKNFPDGLCGGPLAAAMDAPLLLTTTGKTEIAEEYVQDHEFVSGFVLGGTGALSDEAVVDVFGLTSAADIIVE